VWVGYCPHCCHVSQVLSLSDTDFFHALWNETFLQMFHAFYAAN